MSTRLRIDCGYEGTHFFGWGIQPSHPSVQAALEIALGIVLRLDKKSFQTVVAGRTDAGVHALAQVFHVDLPEDFHLSDAALRALPRRLRGALGTDAISVHHVALAPPGFDARFSALSRTYEYRIADLAARKNPLHRKFFVVSPYRLDEQRMNELGVALLGLHDWAAFCRPRVAATTIRKLQSFSWIRDTEGVLIATVKADAFCRSMVRSLVGSAVAVGRGKITVDDVARVREQKARVSQWPVMPAKGLTLVSIEYPPEPDMAQQALDTRARRALTSD